MNFLFVHSLVLFVHLRLENDVSKRNLFCEDYFILFDLSTVLITLGKVAFENFYLWTKLYLDSENTYYYKT